MRFGAKFSVRSTGSRHLGEMKTSGHQGTLQVLIKLTFSFFSKSLLEVPKLSSKYHAFWDTLYLCLDDRIGIVRCILNACIDVTYIMTILQEINYYSEMLM